MGKSFKRLWRRNVKWKDTEAGGKTVPGALQQFLNKHASAEPSEKEVWSEVLEEVKQKREAEMQALAEASEAARKEAEAARKEAELEAAAEAVEAAIEEAEALEKAKAEKVEKKPAKKRPAKRANKKGKK
jgi:colicin import membrane protein